MEKTRPRLTDYLDVHQYLADLYKFRKTSEPDFSYEMWAQELDIDHRSYLRQIVIGRRNLSHTMAQHLAKRLNFVGTEKDYFETLVLFSKAKTPEQRNIFGMRLSRLIRSDVSQELILDKPQFVSSPLIPRIHTILSFEDAPCTLQELATLLEVDSVQVHQALRILIDLNLVEQRGDGFGVLSASFVVPDQLGKGWLQDYHRLSLMDAIHASSLEVEARRYKSLLVAMSADEFEKYLEELQEFTKQTLARFNPKEFKHRRLFQINLNAHAVSLKWGQ